MASVIFPKSINVENLRFNNVRTNPTGSKTIYINYEGGRLAVQTPMMILPYGLGDWNKENEPKKYDLNVSFRGAEINPKTKQPNAIKILLNKMTEIEQAILDAAVKNAKECTDPTKKWFPKAYTREMLEEFFTPIIRRNTDKSGAELPETLKIKLPFDNNTGEFMLESYDMDNNEIQFKDIMTKLKGAKAQLVIEMVGLWMVGTKFGCTWKVIMGKFDIPLMRTVKYAFLKDVDDDGAAAEHDDDLEEDARAAIAAPAAVAKKAVAPVAKKPVVPILPESEDEEDEPEAEPAGEEDEEDAPAEEAGDDDEEEELESRSPSPPPPPPPKKTVAKKAVAAKK